MNRPLDATDRLAPVDAVRGIAMFFIGVSHISFYLINDSSILATHARAIGFIATPNFLLMSGLACGYQLAHSATAATALRIVDRGLFTFLVGHLLVTASLVYMVPPGTAFEHIVITDSIGALLCLAPLLKQASAGRLLGSGAIVFGLSSLLALGWHPVTPPAILLGSLLLAINDGGMPDIGWTSPTLPYLGIFLVGVGLGKLIYERRRGGQGDALSARLAVAGSLAVAAGLALNVGRHFVKPVLTSYLEPKNWADVILTTLNIRHDAPPTLTYGLFYGGIGIALVGLLGMLPRGAKDSTKGSTKDSTMGRSIQLAAVIGRASFVAYVAQQWLIDFVPIWMGFDSWLTPATCPVYLLLTTVIVFWLARLWVSWQANHYMTLGLRPGVRAAELKSGAKAKSGAWADSQVPVFLASAALALFLNFLALENAAHLTPEKLALVPPNPYPWAPAKVAGHQ